MQHSESNLLLSLEYYLPSYDVSPNGQIKFYTLCSKLFDSAARHAHQLQFGYDDMQRENIYWVLSRFHVKMHAFPKTGEKLIVQTWPKGVHKLFFLRDYNMKSPAGETLSSATTAWLVLDGNTGRPQKIDTSNPLHDFHNSGIHAIDQVPGKLVAINDPDQCVVVSGKYSDLDINKHVNAVKYIEWIQDTYPLEVYEQKNVREFQINYQSEIRYEEDVEIRIKKNNQYDKFDYFEGVKSQDKTIAFRSKILFEDF